MLLMGLCCCLGAGTLQYTPPEWYLHGQYEALPLCVWQMGVLLYDMLCGEHPFSTRADIISRAPYIPQQLPRCKTHTHWIYIAHGTS